MRPAARLSDLHVCPLVTGTVPHVGGPIVSGLPTVLVGGLPAACLGDPAACVGPVDAVAGGSPTVLVGGRPLARLGDPTAHGGVIAAGCPTVLVG